MNEIVLCILRVIFVGSVLTLFISFIFIQFCNINIFEIIEDMLGIMLDVFKKWFKKKPKLYSASEIALMSKMGENNELNKLTEEFYLKFQEQYLKDAQDLILIYSPEYYSRSYPLETRIYRIIVSNEEKNFQQFMDFFRKKGWFIRQDIQELSKKKNRYAMSKEEAYKFTVSLSEFGEK